MTIDCSEIMKIPIIADHLATLKSTSKDSYNSETDELYMIDSNLEVVNFDSVKHEYCQGLGLCDIASSVDALYCKGNNFYFIEFKNGRIEKKDIEKKIYDSLLLFSDISKQDISYFRKHLFFILVYNEEKEKVNNIGLVQKHHIQQSNGRDFINYHINKKCQFDLGKYQELYFKEVFVKTAKELKAYFDC